MDLIVLFLTRRRTSRRLARNLKKPFEVLVREFIGEVQVACAGACVKLKR